MRMLPTALSVLARLSPIMAALCLLATASSAEVRLYDSTFAWKLFEVDVGASQGFWVDGSSAYAQTATTRNFPTKVLENEYLRITLLPSFGGRILSIYNKSTRHEELYQNHLGVAYERGHGIFYWNYLYVLGGIFPTFPEAEHGSTWNQVWNFRIVSQTPDSIAVEMSFKDTLPFYPSLSFHGPTSNTGILCRAMVSLAKGANKVGMDVELIPDAKNRSPAYEYWTNVSFAPGSEPGRTFTPSNTELYVPMHEIRFKSDFYSYMADWDKLLHEWAWEFKNSRWLKNWSDRGIAYAIDQDKDWWGVINHDAHEGLFRLGDRTVTPGLKFWSFGDKQGLAGLTSTSNSLENRPFVELWAGRTMAFFSKDRLEGKVEIHEQYLPIAGMDDVDELNAFGAISLRITDSGGIKSARVVHATAFPDQALEYWLEYDGVKYPVTGFTGSGREPMRADTELWFPTRKGKTLAAVIGRNGVEWIRAEADPGDYVPVHVSIRKRSGSPSHFPQSPGMVAERGAMSFFNPAAGTDAPGYSLTGRVLTLRKAARESAERDGRR